MSQIAIPESARYAFLDWLRVIAIFVLLFFHTGMIFVGWGWHIVNNETIASLQWPMDIAHRLRMPLLFVISGAGLWFALNRRSGLEVIRERSLRLLLPAVVGMFLIVPPQIYFERLFRHQWEGGYLEFFFTRVLQFHSYPHGDFSWHHLWFIIYLYVYVLLLMPALLWWRRGGKQLKPGAWLYLLALPLGVNEALLKPLFPEKQNLIADWYVFDHYLLLTAYGFVLASLRNGWEWLAKQRQVSLVLGVGTLILLLSLFNTGLTRHGDAIDAMLANVFTWACLLAFIGYGHRYLSFDNGLLRWARDASYPIYILHQTIIVTIGYFVIQQPWNAWLKYGVILSCTLLSCLLLYQLCVRRFAITRLVFGMKVKVATAERESTLPENTIKKTWLSGN